MTRHLLTVTLAGQVAYRSTVAFAEQLIAGVDGVVGVRNELTWAFDDTAPPLRTVRLAAVATSKLFSPARIIVVDAADSRRKAALEQDAYDVFSQAAETGALKVALFSEAGLA